MYGIRPVDDRSNSAIYRFLYFMGKYRLTKPTHVSKIENDISVEKEIGNE